ncbi:hypothetical protein FB451DRAFT_131453 [Mycena latifolia]|nr:hypothetical protein FB451DRAFT_131453 [Mycena latifolia]
MVEKFAVCARKVSDHRAGAWLGLVKYSQDTLSLFLSILKTQKPMRHPEIKSISLATLWNVFPNLQLAYWLFNFGPQHIFLHRHRDSDPALIRPVNIWDLIWDAHPFEFSKKNKSRRLPRLNFHYWSLSQAFVGLSFQNGSLCLVLSVTCSLLAWMFATILGISDYVSFDCQHQITPFSFSHPMTC